MENDNFLADMRRLVTKNNHRFPLLNLEHLSRDLDPMHSLLPGDLVLPLIDGALDVTFVNPFDFLCE